MTTEKATPWPEVPSVLESDEGVWELVNVSANRATIQRRPSDPTITVTLRSYYSVEPADTFNVAEYIRACLVLRSKDDFPCRCHEATAIPMGGHFPGCRFYSPNVYVKGNDGLSRCACGHVRNHHTRQTVMAGTVVTEADSGCAWRGCGCPWFTETDTRFVLKEPTRE